MDRAIALHRAAGGDAAPQLACGGHYFGDQLRRYRLALPRPGERCPERLPLFCGPPGHSSSL